MGLRDSGPLMTSEAANQVSGTMKDDKDEEEAIRAKYRLMIEEKVMRQVQAIKEKEGLEIQKRLKEQKEIEAKKQKEQELKDKIAQELKNIKELEAKAREKMTNQKVQIRTVDKPQKIAPSKEGPSEFSIDSLRQKKAEEAERLQAEAKLEVERMRIEAEAQAQKRKREAEAARQKAIQEELKKLMEEEEMEKERKILADKQRREEDERKLREQILERRKKAEEEVKAQRRAFEEEKIRENEILKKQMAQEKRNRFKDLSQSKTQSIPTTKELPKRKKLLDNPILNKFEAQAKLPQAEEAIRKAQIESKRRAKPFQLMKDKIKNTSRDSLNKLRRSRQNLGSYLSKDKLKKGPKTSRDKLNQKEGTSVDNDDENKLRKSTMKNYLLSQVLFDGQAEVKAASRFETIHEKTTSKSQEQAQNQQEIERRRKEFELYKREMEKYLSLFEGSPQREQIQENKTSKQAVSLARKPIHNIGNIKDLFENRNELRETTRNLPKSEVGKLDTQAILTFQEDQPKPQTKMDYIPVVIDKEAFERTMNKFEMYKQEEELRAERIKEIQARRRLKEARLMETKETSEVVTVESSDEEYENDLTSTDHDESEEEEVQEQQNDRVWSLKRRVIQELHNLKDMDEQLMNRSALENQRRQALRQVQSEIESITRPVKNSSDNDEEEDDDTPQWIKMIMEMAPLNKFNQTSDPIQNDLQPAERPHQDLKTDDITKDNFNSFEDSVNALIALIDNEEGTGISPSTAKFSQKGPRKPQKLNMRQFSFESSSPKCSKPKPTIENTSNINEVKKKLLRKNSITSHPRKEDQTKGFLGKACDDIKKSLTRRNQESKSSPPPRRSQRRKSIIQAPDFDANFQKRDHSQPKKIWSCQKKTMKELYDLVNERSDMVSSEIATKAQRIMEQTKTLELAETDLSQKKDQSVMQYDEFLANIENYLKTSEQKSVKNTTFDETLKAYLELIQDKTDLEEESNLQNAKDMRNPVAQSNILFRGRNIFKAREENITNQSQKMKPVGKLSTGQLNAIQGTSKDDCIGANAKTISALVPPPICESLRAKFENIGQPTEKHVTSNTQFIKLVHIPMDQSTNTNVKSSNRDFEWKWKQTTIQELLHFVQTNSANHAPELEKTVRKSLNVEQLELRAKEIQKLTSQRDKDFHELLRDLESITSAEFNDEPTSPQIGSLEMEHGEALKSLTSRTEGNKTSKGFSLPKLRQPWKIADIKGKFAQAQEPSKVKRPDHNIGKLETHRVKLVESKSENKSIEKDQNGSAKRIESVPIDKIKNRYEPCNKAPKHTQEIPKVKRKKVLIDDIFHPHESSNLESKNRPKKGKMFSTKSMSNLSKLEPFSINNKRKEEQNVTRSRKHVESWQDIDDPEERKKAILAKHGFKPVRTDDGIKKDDLDDLDTIPSHILNDEILYRKYMRQQIADQFRDQSDSSDEGSVPKNDQHDIGMSLTNLLGAIRSSSIRKAGAEAKLNYRKALKAPNELVNIPGSCSNLKQKFEATESNKLSKSKCENPIENEKVRNLNLKGFWETQFGTGKVSKERGSKPDVEVVANGSRGTALKRFKSAIQLEQSHPKIDLVKQFFRGKMDTSERFSKTQKMERTGGKNSGNGKCHGQSRSMGNFRTLPADLDWNTDSQSSTKHNLKWQMNPNIPDVNVKAKRSQYEKHASTESLSFGNMETELSAIREFRRNASQDDQSYEKTSIAQVSQTELDHIREVRRRHSFVDFDQLGQKDPKPMKRDIATELEAVKYWRESEKSVSDETPIQFSNKDVVQRELEALRYLRQQYPNVCMADCEVAYHNAALKRELEYIRQLRQKLDFQERLPPQNHEQRNIIQRELAALNYARKHLLSKPNFEPDIQNAHQQNIIQKELEALRKLQKFGAFSPEGLFRDEATSIAIKRELEMVSDARKSGQLSKYDPQEHSPINRWKRESINQELEALRRTKSCEQFNFVSNDEINPQKLTIAQELANIKDIRSRTQMGRDICSSSFHDKNEALRHQYRQDMKHLLEARNRRYSLEESEINEKEKKLTERQRINNELQEIRAMRRSKSSCLVDEGEEHQTTSNNRIDDGNFRRISDQSLPHFEEKDPMKISERDRIQLELEELRQSRRRCAISRINNGQVDSGQKTRPLQRSVSVAAFDRQNDAVDTSSRSNDMIRAMFESQAPKIKFGGHGGSLSSLSQTSKPLPVRTRKLQDKRKWVHDTVSKYFNVILEEQEEDDDDIKQLSEREEDEDENNQSVFYPNTDSEDEGYNGNGTPTVPSNIKATSSTRLREMFHTTLNKVSNNLGTSKELLLERFKTSLSNTLN